MPTAISRWISSFLQNRNTQLQFSGTKSKSVPTPAGIPQGSPLSPLLYMYYNADLLDIPKDREMGLGFIDDIVYGVQGDTDKANARKLKIMLKKAEEWRKKHGAQFETSKYVLVHYTRNYLQESDKGTDNDKWDHCRAIWRSKVPGCNIRPKAQFQITSTAH